MQREEVVMLAAKDIVAAMVGAKLIQPNLKAGIENAVLDPVASAADYLAGRLAATYDKLLKGRTGQRA